MNADLQAVKAALAGMTDAELRALIDATSGLAANGAGPIGLDRSGLRVGVEQAAKARLQAATTERRDPP